MVLYSILELCPTFATKQVTSFNVSQKFKKHMRMIDRYFFVLRCEDLKYSEPYTAWGDELKLHNF